MKAVGFLMNFLQVFQLQGEKKSMPKDQTITSILVIGSGPIIIGQAAEFDYSGTQACLALKEEGYRVILVNNNPATIMTEMADVVYYEPLTVDSIEKIIEKEKPDGLLATLGGQTALNLAVELDQQGILEKYGVKLLGTSIDSIIKGEDREAFRAFMKQIGEPVPESVIVTTVEEAKDFAMETGFPIIVRPAYTLGGTGGGIAANLEELLSIVKNGLMESPIGQCLVEKSVAGFKEIEYEVMRDSNDTCITICNMENIDPVGIHTGDSIVVAPSQTLTDEEYQMLRSASIKIISALGIIGGCNIQFALDPNNKKYYVIEVNPRVSRSSALASKATGYPIARMAAKLSVGYTLHELKNPVTGDTFASFEPALDYVVVKFPRWPFDKFSTIDRTLGTQMKATGEVMAIDRNLERAIQKAVHSLELNNIGLYLPEIINLSTDQLKQMIQKPDDRRFFVLLELLRRDVDVDEIYSLTNIDKFFLESFLQMIMLEKKAKETTLQNIDREFFRVLKEKGFSDQYLAFLWKESEKNVRERRKQFGILPSYKLVDTCAAEFASVTSYYYSSYHGETELLPSNKLQQKVLIIGSGPIRIGQGIEFDYSSVQSVMTLKSEGVEAILINNNPETVSTDYETADRLFFEPLTVEDILNVIEAEQIDSVLVQFGGQTAINLTKELEEHGVHLLGTSSETIDLLEDRDKFYQLLEQLNIPHIPGMTAENEDQLIENIHKLQYPVLLRPSYVIGGKGMVIIQNEQELKEFLQSNPNKIFPILIDAYIRDKEAEADLVSDGKNILIPEVIEHIEKAGVHSGDSYAVLPPVTLNEEEKRKIAEYAEKIVNAIQFKGIMNIQYVIHNGEVYVLEVNPRASRTTPIVSKVTGIPLVEYATKILLGKSLSELTKKTGILENCSYYSVKFPVFSTHKLKGLDPLVGPEMKSTGEGLSIGESLESAMQKVFHLIVKSKPTANEVYLDGHLDDIGEICNLIQGTNIQIINNENFDQWVTREKALALLSFRKDEQGYRNRLKALVNKIQVFTEIETFNAFIKGYNHQDFSVSSVQDWYSKNNKKVGMK
jgi:carbamoyl-phosphate synthase large subunit